jgi:hypothetical protein
MSDDELWSTFNDVVEALTERLAVEKRELKSAFRISTSQQSNGPKPTDHAAKRRNIHWANQLGAEAALVQGYKMIFGSLCGRALCQGEFCSSNLLAESFQFFKFRSNLRCFIRYDSETFGIRSHIKNSSDATSTDRFKAKQM